MSQVKPSSQMKENISIIINKETFGITGHTSEYFDGIVSLEG